MTCGLSCKEPPVDNNQRPKQQSSHIILNKQCPGEFHVTQKEQKVNIQLDRDLERGTEYQDDKDDDLDDQNYVRHPIIGQVQDSYLDQRHQNLTIKEY